MEEQHAAIGLGTRISDLVDLREISVPTAKNIFPESAFLPMPARGKPAGDSPEGRIPHVFLKRRCDRRGPSTTAYNLAASKNVCNSESKIGLLIQYKCCVDKIHGAHDNWFRCFSIRGQASKKAFATWGFTRIVMTRMRLQGHGLGKKRGREPFTLPPSPSTPL